MFDSQLYAVNTIEKWTGIYLLV